MASVEYGVAYVARVPASMKQGDLAVLLQEECGKWVADGWRLASTAGDYGATVTLGVWLFFAREPASAPEEDAGPGPGDEAASGEDYGPGPGDEAASGEDAGSGLGQEAASGEDAGLGPDEEAAPD